MHELCFKAGVHRLGDRVATFYVMNTTVNRNRWAVSDKALEEALPTLIGKPLGCGPGYTVDRHYADPVQVGVFTGAKKPDSYALGEAEISDETAWSRLNAGEWGPISVVISSYLERCSVCGADLTGLEDPFNHQCVAEGGYVVVESFTFVRADFVDEPAYSQAGLLGVVPVELLAACYVSQSGLEGVPGPEASRLEPGVEEDELSEERFAQLEEQLGSLRGEVEQLRAELEKGTPKAKHGGVSDGVEAAMCEARLRLFGRTG